MKGKVLIVDDDQAMCEMLDFDLRSRGFTTAWYTIAEKAFSNLKEVDYDVLLADIKLPGMTGIELCERVVANRPDIPVIMMTAFGNIETAIAAIRAGAYDFVNKPVDLDILAVALDRAITYRNLKEKVKILNQAVKHTQMFGDILGDSISMHALFSQIVRVANTEISVLILGESGTGKELVARSLHKQSRRHTAPFIPINCSALPEALLESELFGHKRGAFTDAKSDHKGLFLEAEGGTLFLDEIAEIPMVLQPKLLRALEEHRIRPVGGDSEVAFDVRIVAATNRDIESAVEEGLFREDLFYRLNVIQMEVPPLRARGTDVLLLARHFIEYFSRSMDKQVVGLSNNAAQKILAYSWPGNVRELRNAIERAVALTSFEKLAVEDLPKKIRAYRSDHILVSTQDPTELISMEEVERRYILHVLKAIGDNRTLAARILKMDRKTLYRKLQRYGVDES
jgi:DNA-binding NtrC family response regulator